MDAIDNLRDRAKKIRGAFLSGSVTNEEVGLLLLDIINFVYNNPGSGGGGGLPGTNYWSKDEIKFLDQYLVVLDDKIKASFADNAKLWDEALFGDYVDQAIRTQDEVQFKSILTDLVKTISLEATKSIKTETLTTSSISTPSFISGFGGSGTRLKDDHLELDAITVRKQMTVRELMIEKIKSVGGTLIVSIGAMKITEVTDGGTYFKCNFDNDGGNIDNPFVVDDLVMCQTFGGNNIKRYWRRVTSVAVDYFNLSKTDCESGSAEPAAGDEIVQLGNRTDTSRQSAMILCAVGADAPYIDQYAGINNFTLAGKLITREGNLSGIVDDALGQLSGSGLYAKNAYLRGKLALASGKTVENALGEIDTKTGTAQSTAETAQQTANNAASELSKTNTTLTTVTRDVKLLADAQSGFSVSVSEVRKTVDNLQIGGVNYLNNSRCDTLAGWGLSEGTARIVNDAKFGNVVEYTRVSGVGNFQRGFTHNANELSNTEVVYFVIAKQVSSGGSWYFGGWNNTYLKLSATTSTKIYLGDGWYQYWVTFESESSINPFGAFGINSMMGVWQVYACGILKGNKPTPSWSPSLADQQAETERIAQLKADAAKNAAISAANNASQAKIDLLKTQELANLDGKIDDEEARAIKDAQDKYDAAVSEAQKKALGASWVSGKILNDDPTFQINFNGIGTYNNLVNGNVILTRMARLSDSPFSPGYNIQIKNIGALQPGLGGFHFANQSRASAIFICRFVAKIPIGYTVEFASNSIGQGGVEGSFWATPNAGTGKWEEYIYVVKCGASGGFSTTNFYYLQGSVGGTPSSPVSWYLAYASVFDVTDGVNAQTEARKAAETANAATAKLSDWASDSKISPAEKTALKQQLADIQAEYIDIESSAEKLNKKAGADWANYNAAYNAAIAAINKYTASSPETIAIGSDYANIAAYYSRRQIMLTTIAYTQTNGKIVKTIDARSLDQNKYYPVVILLSSSRRSSIKVEARLYGSSVPAWATHSAGFSCDCTWEVSGSGWGTIYENRYIHSFTYRFAASTMIGSIGQMTNSSYEYIYVRGGGIYTITTTEASLIELKTSAFTVSQQTIDILTSITEPAVSVDVVRTELTGKITVLNDSITSLVTKTEYNALGQRVSQAEASITTLSNQISLKVSSTDFNALSGRVKTTESSITLLKDRISLLVKTGNIETGLVIKPECIEISGATIFRDTSNNQTFSVFGSGGYALNLNNKFKVTTLGKLYATEVDITGRIIATSGEFTGKVSSNASGNMIEIDPANRRLIMRNAGNSSVSQFYFFENDVALDMMSMSIYGTYNTTIKSSTIFMSQVVPRKYSTTIKPGILEVVDDENKSGILVVFKGLRRVSNTSGWDRMLVNLTSGEVAYG